MMKGARVCERDGKRVSNRTAPRALDLLPKSPDMMTLAYALLEDAVSDKLPTRAGLGCRSVSSVCISFVHRPRSTRYYRLMERMVSASAG